MHAIVLAKTLIWKGGPGASFWPLPRPSYQHSEQRERMCPTQDPVPGAEWSASQGPAILIVALIISCNIAMYVRVFHGVSVIPRDMLRSIDFKIRHTWI